MCSNGGGGGNGDARLSFSLSLSLCVSHSSVRPSAACVILLILRLCVRVKHRKNKEHENNNNEKRKVRHDDGSAMEAKAEKWKVEPGKEESVAKRRSTPIALLLLPACPPACLYSRFKTKQNKNNLSALPYSPLSLPVADWRRRRRKRRLRSDINDSIRLLLLPPLRHEQNSHAPLFLFIFIFHSIALQNDDDDDCDKIQLE